MKKNKIFAGLVLAIFLFAIPKALAIEEPIYFSGDYEANNPGLTGAITGVIEAGECNGYITVKGSDWIFDLVLEKEYGNYKWFTGDLDRLGHKYDMRMIVRIDADNGRIRGGFGIPDLRFEGTFGAKI